MQEEHTPNKIALVTIPCPPDVFDVPDASIKRRKRIAVWRMDEIGRCKSTDELYPLLKEVIPEWTNVCDAETGEPLPNPKEDHTVFGKLDSEQQRWLSDVLKVLPGKLKKFTQDRTLAD